jgi:hypothetical protein
MKKSGNFFIPDGSNIIEYIKDNLFFTKQITLNNKT